MPRRSQTPRSRRPGLEPQLELLLARARQNAHGPPHPRFRPRAGRAAGDVGRDGAGGGVGGATRGGVCGGVECGARATFAVLGGGACEVRCAEFVWVELGFGWLLCVVLGASKDTYHSRFRHAAFWGGVVTGRNIMLERKAGPERSWNKKTGLAFGVGSNSVHI